MVVKFFVVVVDGCRSFLLLVTTPPGSQNIANEMQMADGKLYLSDRPEILYSPNRTNGSQRQASTRVREYREIFQSVANEMQMADRKLYLSDRPKNSLFAK